LLGDIVNVSEISDDQKWVRVSEKENLYEGWIEIADLVRGSDHVRYAWKRGPRLLVIKSPGIVATDEVTIPFGSILPMANDTSDAILLPDGRVARIESGDVVPLNKHLSKHDAIQQIKGFIRVPPFKEGGNTVGGMDSVGLIYLFYRSMGVSVPRIAAKFMSAGLQISEDDVQEGDVAFLKMFDAPLRPILVLEHGEVFLEAFAASGVNYLSKEQAENRGVVEYRRYLSLEDRDRTDTDPASEFSLLRTVLLLWIVLAHLVGVLMVLKADSCGGRLRLVVRIVTEPSGSWS
jgi:hypothetical protein